MSCVNTQWLPAAGQRKELLVVVAAASISLPCSIHLCCMGLRTATIAAGPLNIIEVLKEHNTLYKPSVCVL